MKKLLVKCAILVVITGTLLYVGGQIYRQSYSYAAAMSETGKFSAIPESVDIAVFGNSHARDAIRFAPDGLTLFSFAIGNQTPQYDAALLRQYQDHLHPGSLVVLNVSYSSPFCKQSKAKFNGLQERYYEILDLDNIVEASATHYYLRKFSLLLTVDSPDLFAALKTGIDSWFSSLTVNTSEASAAPLAASLSAISPHPFNQEELMEYTKGRAIADCQTFFPAVNPEMMDSYREILTMCRENEWRPVLVCVPHLSMYNNCLTAFNKDFFKIYREAVSELSQEFDVPWLDYSHESPYTEREDYFTDDREHMQTSGAEAFDVQFFADLRELGLVAF